MMLSFEEWRWYVKTELPKQPHKINAHYTAFWDEFTVDLPNENSIAYFRVKARD